MIEAVAWVEENKEVIKRRSFKYLDFAVHLNEEDVLSLAKQAAIMTYSKLEGDWACFDWQFWSLFMDQLKSLIPNPLYQRVEETAAENGVETGKKKRIGTWKWSQSIPSTLCTDYGDDDLSLPLDLMTKEAISCAMLDGISEIEEIYWGVFDHLHDMERKVIYHHLGLGAEGELSLAEIARRMDCTSANIIQTFNRALKRISKLVADGVINPSEMPEVNVGRCRQVEKELENWSPARLYFGSRRGAAAV